MELKERKDFFDILKGIGIFFIVIGHIASGVIPSFNKAHNIFTNYVYTYHLALFFFVSGCLYNEEKYINNPSLNFLNRFKRCFLIYFLYCFFVEILFYVILKVPYSHGKHTYYDFFSFLQHTFRYALMQDTPSLSQSLWFVPPFIIASSIFAFIVTWGNGLQQKITKYFNAMKNKNIIKNIFIILVCTLFSLAGYYEIYHHQKFNYRIEIACFVLLLLALGYFFNKYIKNKDKFLNYYIAILLLFISIYFSYFSTVFRHQKMDLKGDRFEYIQYYGLAIIGIYQVMFFAKSILKLKCFRILKNFFCLLGKASFEIMAFHRVIFYFINAYLLFFLHNKKTNNDIIFNVLLIFYAALTCFVIAFAKKMILKLKKER